MRIALSRRLAIVLGAVVPIAETIRRRHQLGDPSVLTCGMAYASFFSQFAALDRPDPSGAPSSVVVAIKGAGLALAIVGLVAALAGGKENT